MMNVWCMNLKDNRDEDKRNKDAELKFRLCMEKEIIAIGWVVSEVVNSWQEYLDKANKARCNQNNFSTGTKALKRMKCGDLVWVKNPVSKEYYLVQITDNSPEPSIYRNLMEFDICAYRRCRYWQVEPSFLIGALCRKNLSARRAIERMSMEKRNETIAATLALFEELKKEKV